MSVDHVKKAVVVTIRGTLSLQVRKDHLAVKCQYADSTKILQFFRVISQKLIACNLFKYIMFQDILTDFSVEPEVIPLDNGDPTWFGHKVCTVKC